MGGAEDERFPLHYLNRTIIQSIIVVLICFAGTAHIPFRRPAMTEPIVSQTMNRIVGDAQAV